MAEIDSETDEILSNLRQNKRMESEHIQPEADIQPGTSNEYGVPKSGRFREYCKINNQMWTQSFRRSRSLKSALCNAWGDCRRIYKKVRRTNHYRHFNIQNFGIFGKTRAENRTLQNLATKNGPWMRHTREHNENTTQIWNFPISQWILHKGIRHDNPKNTSSAWQIKRTTYSS